MDDEAAVLDLFREALQDNGYIVDVAATEAEARELLGKWSYQFVVADWRLPDGDGTVIAGLAAAAGARAFVMSGYLQHMPAGTIDLRQTLMKPLRPSDLLAVVRDCIGRRLMPGH